MFENVAENLQLLADSKGINIDLLKEIVESTITLALRKQRGEDINFHIVFDEKNNPTIYRAVLVVEESENENKEISFEEAKKMDENIILGDEVWIIVEKDQVKEFGRIESEIAKNTFIQKLKELERNIIYNEFKRRENQLVNGYFQREQRGNIYVDLGETEGLLHKRDQSPREHYAEGDKIRAFIYSVENDRSGHPIIYLTRTKGDFIRKIFEIEIPEVADGTVEIKDVVRHPGLKTKVAVISNKPEVDPTGACIGQKGVRIQSIIKEIAGEKIDIVKWSRDIREYIAESLTPVKKSKVIITDATRREAIVIVPDDQINAALGKNGCNIKLASQLTKYYLNLKTETDIKENPDILKNIVSLDQLFSDEPYQEDTILDGVEKEAVSNLYSLENIDESIIKTLIDGGIGSIEVLYNLSASEIMDKTSLDSEKIAHIMNVLKESVEIVDDDEGYTEIEDEIIEEIEVYECPNCSTEITEDMEECPNCGVKISFE